MDNQRPSAPKNLASVEPAHLADLYQGAPTRNLIEWLVVNLWELMHSVSQQALSAGKQIPSMDYLAAAEEAKAYIPKKQERLTTTQAFPILAKQMLENGWTWANVHHRALLIGHSSDLVRGIGAYLISQSGWPVGRQLEEIRPLADDAHYSVREIAWMALRPQIVANWPEVRPELIEWAQDDSENIRRFAAEITRPKGVWCARFTSLVQHPWEAEGLLALLVNDPSRYVQLSVGNWLNDASYFHPEWLEEWLDSFESLHSEKAFQHIRKRARRTIEKRKALPS